MRRKFAVLAGIVGAALVGGWIRSRRVYGSKPADNDAFDGPMLAHELLPEPAAHIDDDASADLIRRAQPALERARQMYSS